MVDNKSILKIGMVIIVLLIIIALLHRFILFSIFQRNIRPITEQEEKEALNILNNSLDLDEYQVKFGNIGICNSRNKNIVYVELIKNKTTDNYIVDLDKNKAIKKDKLGPLTNLFKDNKGIEKSKNKNKQ